MDFIFPKDFVWGTGSSAYQIEASRFDDGKVAVVKKSLSRMRAKNDLIEILKGIRPDQEFDSYTVFTCGTENLQRFEESLSEAGISFKSRMQVGPTIGAHVGPEVFGLFIVEAEQ